MTKRRKAIKKAPKRKLPAACNNGEFFAGGSPTVILNRADAVLQAQLNKTAWAGNQEYLKLMQETRTEYGTICLQIDAGNLSLIPHREELETVLVNQLLVISKNSEVICIKNKVKLSESGYQLTGAPKPPKPIHSPENLRVTSPITQQINARISKVYSSKVYFYEIAEVVNGVTGTWTPFEYSFVNYTFTGLTTGKTYAIRVCAVSKLGEKLYCEPITRLCN